MKKLLNILLINICFLSIAFSQNELIGLIDKTTGKGIPDARTIFISSKNGVVTNLTVNGIFIINGTNFNEVVSNLVSSLSDEKYVIRNEINSISSDMIENYSITSNKINYYSIFNHHLVSNSIAGQNIITNSIEENHLKDRIISSNKIQTNTVDKSHLKFINSFSPGTVMSYDTNNNTFVWYTIDTLIATNFISSVFAGDGLVGGAEHGEAILNVGGSPSILVDSNSISVNTNWFSGVIISTIEGTDTLYLNNIIVSSATITNLSVSNLTANIAIINNLTASSLSVNNATINNLINTTFTSGSGTITNLITDTIISGSGTITNLITDTIISGEGTISNLVSDTINVDTVIANHISGVMQPQRIVDNHTVTYTVTTNDFAKILVMSNSLDKVFTLPITQSSHVGNYFTFVKRGSGKLTVEAQGSTIIVDGTKIINELSDEVWASCTLSLIEHDFWIVTSFSGTWYTE